MLAPEGLDGFIRVRSSAVLSVIDSCSESINIQVSMGPKIYNGDFLGNGYNDFD